VRLLLDTHIWIWSLLDPSQLGRRTARALAAEDVELWLSPISTWELLVLARKGRIVLEKDARTWAREALEKVPMNEAPMTHEVALETARIDLPHADPADRILAATARIFELTLVTADARLGACKGVAVMRNR
jgi:PIN domain nuclease of toxin-antitoxin system